MKKAPDCVVCSTLKDVGRVRKMWIYEDGPRVAPTPDRTDGHLLLVLRRHTTTLAALTVPEAQSIGLWLSRGSHLLELTQGAEHVYLQRLETAGRTCISISWRAIPARRRSIAESTSAIGRAFRGATGRKSPRPRRLRQAAAAL